MSDAHGVARDQLRAFIERIERLEEEKKTIADDIKDVYGEAKATGFDTVILKRVIALRKKDEQERLEQEMILSTYLIALGMLPEPQDPSVSREDRAKRRMSESMADHKALVDEIADAGLISEEARAENKALADAVATKLGNGPVSPAMALQSPHNAAEAISERADIMIDREEADEGKAATTASGVVFTHDIETLLAAHEAEESAAVNQPETANEASDGSNADRPSLAAHDDEESAASISEPAPASQGEAEAPSVERIGPQADEATIGSADANTGGDDEEVDDQTSHAAQAGAVVQKAAPATLLRPHCLQPSMCRSGTRDHCYSCSKEMRKGEMG